MLYARERTNYPVTVSVDDTGTGFAVTVQAAAPVDPEQVCALLQTAAAGLASALADAPATAAARRCRCWARPSGARSLAGWNDTRADVPAATLPELFAAQAARTPDAVAVTWRGRGR